MCGKMCGEGREMEGKGKEKTKKKEIKKKREGKGRKDIGVACEVERMRRSRGRFQGRIPRWRVWWAVWSAMVEGVSEGGQGKVKEGR